MKNIFSIIAFILLINKPVYANFNPVDHYLAINAYAPPAAIVVVDSLGNKAGVELSDPLDEFGRGSSISQIPGSDVEQQNIVSDEGTPLNQPNTNTSWSIFIVDQPAQAYTINLVGIDSGTITLTLSGGYESKDKKNISAVEQSFLVEGGVTRSVQVNYDPTAGALTITTTINSGNFFQDTQIACSLGDISPTKACEVLEDLATEVEKAIIQGDTHAEALKLKLYLLILNRLHNWGNKDARHDWDDFKDHPECDELRKDRDDTIFFAKDPAYSALKLDAETLLNALP